MNVVHLGSEYGGWWIDLDAVRDGDTVLDIGVGHDVSFALELLKHRKVRIILIDPSEESRSVAAGVPGSQFICAAVTAVDGHRRLYQHASRQTSASLCPDNRNVSEETFDIVPCLALWKLIDEFRPSLVKMDIEGEEYACYRDCFSVRQVAIEFHHRLMVKKTPQYTEDAIADFRSHHYEVIHRSEHDDVTFLSRYWLQK